MNRFRDAALGLSVVLCAATALAYYWRADWYAGVTIWPVWFWAVLGVVLLAVGWRKGRHLWAGCGCTMWIGYVLAFSDSPSALIRRPHQYTHGQSMRVVSLNCAGEAAAAAEVAVYQPDFVLLQESPPTREAVEALGLSLFGKDAAVVWTPDVSILGRAPAVSLDLPRTVRAVGLRRGDLVVVSLRLSPHLMWADVWSMKWWRDHVEVQESQRKELRQILDAVRERASAKPLILGGDFNAPADNAIYRVLRPSLHDSFHEGGVGWGNTLLNGLPMWRIDQVWISEQFHARVVQSHKTLHSDHRMVICDLE
jgi:endonuclease/exonuclease/phosphatase (EEP) superfamily protein YafD